jgi:hypothetical protein
MVYLPRSSGGANGPEGVDGDLDGSQVAGSVAPTWRHHVSRFMNGRSVANPFHSIMPPGTFHAVFTPVPAITTGGMVYLPSSLAPIPFCMVQEHLYGQLAFNSVYPGSSLYLFYLVALYRSRAITKLGLDGTSLTDEQLRVLVEGGLLPPQDSLLHLLIAVIDGYLFPPELADDEEALMWPAGYYADRGVGQSTAYSLLSILPKVMRDLWCTYRERILVQGLVDQDNRQRDYCEGPTIPSAYYNSNVDEYRKTGKVPKHRFVEDVASFKELANAENSFEEGELSATLPEWW